MDYRIIIPRPWRYRDPRRGMQELPPGSYRVPDDIADKFAKRAILEGMAKLAKLETADAEMILVSATGREIAEWAYAGCVVEDAVSEALRFDFTKVIHDRTKKHSIHMTVKKLVDLKASGGLRNSVEVELTAASHRLLQDNDPSPRRPRVTKPRISPRNRMRHVPENKSPVA